MNPERPGACVVSDEAPRIQHEVADDPRRIAAIADDWEALTANAGYPFAGPNWFTAWWDAFGSRRRLCLLLLWRDSELAGVFPMHRVRGHTQAMVNAETPAFTPVAADDVAMRAVCDAALGLTGGRLIVRSLPAGSAGERALTEAAVRAGCSIRRLPAHVSPIVATADSLDAWRAVTRSGRRDLERVRRKLEREHDVERRVLEVPRDFESELREGLAVEASGWKGQAGTAILSNPDLTRFYECYWRSEFAAGRLRFSTLRIDGSLAAFDIAVVAYGRLWGYKAGYDERFRRFAPGSVLRLSVIERCFELSLDAYELLGSASLAKRRFATAERHHTALHIWRRGPSGLARQTWHGDVRPNIVKIYRALKPARGSTPVRR